jgi:hypothetical protein
MNRVDVCVRTHKQAMLQADLEMVSIQNLSSEHLPGVSSKAQESKLRPLLVRLEVMTTT